MNLREAHYRVAANNKKCALCGYRILRRLPASFSVITCILMGTTIEDDHTCDYWKYEEQAQASGLGDLRESHDPRIESRRER